MNEAILLINKQSHLSPVFRMNLVENKRILVNIEHCFEVAQSILTSQCGEADIERILGNRDDLEAIAIQLPEHAREIQLVLNAQAFDLTQARGGSADRLAILKSEPLMRRIRNSYPIVECFFRTTLFFSNTHWEVFKSPDHDLWTHAETYALEALLVMNANLLPLDKMRLLQSNIALQNIQNNPAGACWILLNRDRIEGDIEPLFEAEFSLFQSNRHYAELNFFKKYLERQITEADEAKEILEKSCIAMAQCVDLIHKVGMVVLPVGISTAILLYGYLVGFLAMLSGGAVINYSLAELRNMNTRKQQALKEMIDILEEKVEELHQERQGVLQQIPVVRAKMKRIIGMIEGLIYYSGFSQSFIEQIEAQFELESNLDLETALQASYWISSRLHFLSFTPEAKKQHLAQEAKNPELPEYTINSNLPALPNEVIQQIRNYYFFSLPKTAATPIVESSLTPSF